MTALRETSWSTGSSRSQAGPSSSCSHVYPLQQMHRRARHCKHSRLSVSWTRHGVRLVVELGTLPVTTAGTWSLLGQAEAGAVMHRGTQTSSRAMQHPSSRAHGLGCGRAHSWSKVPAASRSRVASFLHNKQQQPLRRTLGLPQQAMRMLLRSLHLPHCCMAMAPL